MKAYLIRYVCGQHIQRLTLQKSRLAPLWFTLGNPTNPDSLLLQLQVQNGFPTERILTGQGRVLAIVFDPVTRLLRGNTTEAYPVVADSGDNRTFTFSYPFELPNVAVGDAVVVRPACVNLDPCPPVGVFESANMTRVAVCAIMASANLIT